MPKARITNNLRKLRFEHDEMTQQALADAAECTRQTVIMLEHERYSPSLALAFRIARIFDRRVVEIFAYADDS